MKELLIYGLRKDETRDYMEELLFSGAKSMDTINKVIELAKKEGFHSFRVATFRMGEMPNFTKSLNI
jgi:hypothetical protein